ncbi:MAG: DPP IV N-terminal domain-containing protein [Bacteroidetes bacterium]|nr:DPP IV N-terminal domain-containing protein [Bacteroidota bacterium]
MKKLLFSLLIGLIVSLIVAQETEKTFTLDNVIKRNEFRSQGVYGIKSLADGKHYTTLENGDINIYSYKTGKLVKIFVNGSDLTPRNSEEPIKLRNYTFSEDEQKMLIPTETERIYRWSSKSRFYIWDLQAKQLTALSDHGKQRLAHFSPDGSKIAFVRENNLYYKELSSGEEIQITVDGKDRFIINGTTDWVYEEEFGFTKGFFWSPDGSKIAYYSFNESNVVEYEMQLWGELYPEMHRYKYPKAGEDNSLVSIHIYDLEKGLSIPVDIGTEPDQYIPRIKWTKKEGILSIQRMNRLQNRLEILLADTETGMSHVIYAEENKYYIDITDHLIFIDSDHFLITSEADGYNHIYYYDMQGNLVQQLTKGRWDVTDLKGYDPERKLIFFEAAKTSALNKDLLSVSLKGEISMISSKEGSNSASFSKNFDYYINTYTNANTPPYISMNKSNGKEIRVLEDNQALIDKLQEYGYREREFLTITTEDGISLNAWRILPHNFDKNEKYPVLMYVYGGPGSQTVLNSWGGGNLWYQMLAQNGIFCISVDNRGTGARGEEFKKMTYLELGKYETIDQIAAAKYLASLSWIDDGHIGIFGWSYGGFMATLCMTKGADIFDLGVAVAPVTNWKYYDNIYTERFMRTPQENPDGYEDNSPINFTDQMEGKFLLIHGTADDNVHIQNSIDLITALTESNKQFEMQFYPNKNHGIYGGNTRYHLYKRITDFLYKNLLVDSIASASL